VRSWLKNEAFDYVCSGDVSVVMQRY